MSAKVYRIIIKQPDGIVSYYSWVRTDQHGNCCVIKTLDETSNTIKYFNTKKEAEKEVKRIKGLLDKKMCLAIDACDNRPSNFDF